MGKTYFFSVVESDEPEAEILNDSVLNESLAQSSSINQTLSSNGHAKKDEIGTDLELKRPRKVKDFTVLANLVELASHCIPKCDAEW